MVGCSLFFFSSRRRHTRFDCDWSSDVCSSDLRLAHDRTAGPRSRSCARRLPPDGRSSSAGPVGRGAGGGREGISGGGGSFKKKKKKKETTNRGYQQPKERNDTT